MSVSRAAVSVSRCLYSLGSDRSRTATCAATRSFALVLRRMAHLNAQGLEMSVSAPNFYRRMLPHSCVSFASDDGKKMFTESLLAGNANIYFKLAGQFITQDEPAYCGPSSLVMCLNALDVDPGKVWKSPWRWYHESMLDCCLPMESIKKSGLNIFQMKCLAQCNRLKCELSIAERTAESLDSLREAVMSSVRSDSKIVVAAYSRGILGQTGAGHFSPLAAFHAESDSVLVLDVARFKYPAHWVTLSLLHEAMCTIDPSTNRNRGYLCLSLDSRTRPLVVFGIRTSVASNDSTFADSVLTWRDFLLEEPMDNESDEWVVVCRRFAQCFAGHALTCKGVESSCCERNGSCATETEEMAECSQRICREIRQSTAAQVTMSSAVAALMLAWPYEPGYSTRSDRLKGYAENWLRSVSTDTQNEIAVLKRQLITVIECMHPLPKIKEVL